MTAIIVGRLPKANFIVVDAMVQLKLDVADYKECRLQDKISDIDLSEQYLVLAGEQLIADGAGLLNYWSQTRKIKYDLFDKNHFKNVLELALRYRKYHTDITEFPIIEQAQTDVYIISRNGIKYYAIKYQDSKFEIVTEELFPENRIIINYAGNSKIVLTPKGDIDILDFGIKELNKEHERRKLNGISIGQPPLKYEFEGKFSSAILPTDITKNKERKYPFEFPTDVFLSNAPEWDYITNPEFRYLPIP